MNTEAVFFDLDDTLFDRRRAQAEVLRILMRQFPEVFDGISEESAWAAFQEADEISLAAFYAGGGEESVRVGRARAFLGLLGRDVGPAQAMARAYVRAYAQVDCPVPGAGELVRNMATRLPLGVISNGLADVQYTKLDGLGLRDAFGCVMIAGELDLWKPGKAIFLAAATALGQPPQACLHVGDLFHDDVLGARGAGMRACWFNPGGEAVPEGFGAPDLEIRALGELPGLISAHSP